MPKPAPRSEIRERIAEQNEDAVVLEPAILDAAIVGMTSDGRVVYDRTKIVDVLLEDTPKATREEIEEHVSFNTEGSLPSMGEYAPVLVEFFGPP